MDLRTSDQRQKDAEKIDQLLSETRSQVRSWLDWTRRFSRVGKLKLEAARLQRMRGHRFQELGQKTYLLLKEGTFNPSELNEVVSEIDSIKRNLEALNREMEGTAKTKSLGL